MKKVLNYIVLVAALFMVITFSMQEVNAQTTKTKIKVRNGNITSYFNYMDLKENNSITILNFEKQKSPGCNSGWYKAIINEENVYICSDNSDFLLKEYFDNLILVNKDNKIKTSYQGNLVSYKNITVSKYVVDDLKEMEQAALEDNVELVISNAYRSPERQERIYNRNIKRLLKKGFSEDETYRLTNLRVMNPYYSEHQTGLAFDFKNSYSRVENKKQIDWLQKNSYKYGFILRYPKNKTYITQIMYESWHYRHVGKKAANEIYEKNITFEEYLEELSNEE